MRINLSKHGAKNRKLRIVNVLIREFCEDNDIKYSTILTDYISTPNGTKALVNWAEPKGYKLTYWCMAPLKFDSNLGGNRRIETTWIGVGIDLDESNEKIVELKLKQK
jgi:hypothetical protein